MALGSTAQSLALVPEVLEVGVNAPLRLNALVGIFGIREGKIDILNLLTATSKVSLAEGLGVD